MVRSKLYCLLWLLILRKSSCFFGISCLWYKLFLVEIVSQVEMVSLIEAVLRSYAYISYRKQTETINQKMDLSNLPDVKGARFDSHHNEHEPLCLQGTRVEILSSVASWIEDPQGHCIFWLRGLAGTGKSTISRTVAREFSKKSISVTSFFFKKGEGDRARTAHLFATIAHQLVHALPDAAPFIRRAVEDNPNISDKVLSYQFQELILKPLAQMKSNRC